MATVGFKGLITNNFELGWNNCSWWWSRFYIVFNARI